MLLPIIWISLAHTFTSSLDRVSLHPSLLLSPIPCTPFSLYRTHTYLSSSPGPGLTITLLLCLDLSFPYFHSLSGPTITAISSFHRAQPCPISSLVLTGAGVYLISIPLLGPTALAISSLTSPEVPFPEPGGLFPYFCYSLGSILPKPSAPRMNQRL